MASVFSDALNVSAARGHMSGLIARSFESAGPDEVRGAKVPINGASFDARDSRRGVLGLRLRPYRSSRRFSRLPNSNALKPLSKLAANGAALCSREYFHSKRLAGRHNGPYDPRELVGERHRDQSRGFAREARPANRPRRLSVYPPRATTRSRPARAVAGGSGCLVW